MIKSWGRILEVSVDVCYSNRKYTMMIYFLSFFCFEYLQIHRKLQRWCRVTEFMSVVWQQSQEIGMGARCMHDFMSFYCVWIWWKDHGNQTTELFHHHKDPLLLPLHSLTHLPPPKFLNLVSHYLLFLCFGHF